MAHASPSRPEPPSRALSQRMRACARQWMVTFFASAVLLAAALRSRWIVVAVLAGAALLVSCFMWGRRVGWLDHETGAPRHGRLP